jgi:hypothetical protein
VQILPGRDNHVGMPEIVAAHERAGNFFGVIQVVLDGELHAFEFGVDKPGYLALKRVLHFRPFDALAGVAYRYSFAGSVGRCGSVGDPISFSVRIEQGVTQRNLRLKVHGNSGRTYGGSSISID